MKSARLLSAALIAYAATSCSTETTPVKPFEALAGGDYFVAYVKPVLSYHCIRCHNGSAPPAGLSLVQRNSLYAPTKRDRAYVVPGDPASSLLLTAIRPGGSHPRISPPLEASLSEQDLAILHEWIEDGAHWPDAPAGFIMP